eukprot:437015_1
MSLANEWKKEIDAMSPGRIMLKDKIINIKEKRKSSRLRYLSPPKKKSIVEKIQHTLTASPYIAYIIVFFLFYILGWIVVFKYMNEAEHDLKHKSQATLLHPNGEITHHLPEQIKNQIIKLAKLESIIEAKEQLGSLMNQAGNALVNIGNEIHKYPLNVNNNKDIKNVAINILITRDPGIQGGFLDSAGALIQSIHEAKSKHNIHLIALVHKDVKYCLPILEFMGYEIRSYDTPFHISDVLNKKIAAEMKTDGCCGILEALKLWAWTWTEFDVVLSIDADVHFHQNFDELFELNTTLGWTHGATAHMNQELMNGGYLIIRPNIEHYNDMIALLVEGDFRDGSGWKGSGIGWVYGGRTIQGIVPYYYLKVAIGDETEFERCKYNNMVEIEKCRNWTFPMVTSNHFTWCQKPWYCITHQGQSLCDAFRKHWWERSNKFEIEMLGFDKPRIPCKKRPYPFIQYYESPNVLKYFKEHGYNTTKPDIPPEFFEKLKKKHG